jgi:hypothetical protein
MAPELQSLRQNHEFQNTLYPSCDALGTIAGMNFATEGISFAGRSSTFARSGGSITPVDMHEGDAMMFLETATRALPESIESLDLSYLGQKILDDDAFEAQRRNGEQLWDEARVARALQEYKQFLALMYWYPKAALTPSEDIDDVWHTHVLNTARYQADCEMIFGCFQHHSPTSGTSEEVQDQHLTDRDETLQLFEEAFGEVPQSYAITVERRCGRTVDRRCGRMVADRRCGRKTANRRCGRTADRRCGRVVERRCGRI